MLLIRRRRVLYIVKVSLKLGVLRSRSLKALYVYLIVIVIVIKIIN